MAMFNIPWLTDSIKKCTIKYLIERYLGHFLFEELNYSQLDIELIEGTASIENIPLNVNTINQEVSPYFPLKFLEGFVNRIELSVPWSSLWTDSCAIQLDGIKLNFCKLKKCARQDPTQTSILSKSMMASSMEMAEEILHQETDKYEGLEKFAQLISSIIRRVKLSARNTVIKFVFPQKSGVGKEIEFRIGSIKCEEEEITLNGSNNSDDKNNSMLSDTVTKRITVEGIDVLINDVLVSRLQGKHTFKLRFHGQRIDMEAYFGSSILAILTAEHLDILKQFIQVIKVDDSLSKQDPRFFEQPEERLMTAQDYLKVQEILHHETNNNSTGQTSNLNFSMYQNSGKNWAYNDSTMNEDDQFLSFHQDRKDSRRKSFTKENSAANNTLFTCVIKLPGIILCLISEEDDEKMMPDLGNMPMIDNVNTFIGLNSEFLDKILCDYKHVRLLASNLCLETMVANTLQFSCSSLGVYESFEGLTTNLIWVNDKDNDAIRPSARLKFSKNTIDFILAPTTVHLDLTFLERHSKFLDLFKSSPECKTSEHIRKTDPNDFTLNIECEALNLELFFPIPDLRPERNDYSVLHDEVMLLELLNTSIHIDNTRAELSCSDVTINMRIENEIKKLFHSNSEQRAIKLLISTVNPVIENHEQNFHNNCTMQESVNFFHSSTIMNQNSKQNEPFQVKRKMFNEESHEQVLTPGDREHMKQFMAFNRETTKLYICLQIPFGQIYFEDKNMFELIYNRFANDLILWTPFLPQRHEKQENLNSSCPHDDCNDCPNDKINEQIYEDDDQSGEPELILPTMEPLINKIDLKSMKTISPPTIAFSTINEPIFYSYRKLSSTDGSLIDSTSSETSFHSVFEATTSNTLTVQSNKKSQIDLVFEVQIENLNIDFCTEPHKKNNIFAQNFEFEVVVGSKNNPSTVLCLFAENLVYRCEDEQILISNSYLDSNNEITLAVDIKRHGNSLKKIKLAVQLKNGLFLGLDLPVYESLWNFVNVKDEPVAGYICPKIVIELHADVVKSALSFNSLKERLTLIHCQDLYLTSMVVENTNQTILRFFIEEALLGFKKSKQCLDTLNNYVSVINSGIIDLNLKISKDGQIEMKISNNMINVTACPDSLASLFRFIQSFTGESKITDSQEKIFSTEDFNEFNIHKNDDLKEELIADALYECSVETKRNGSLLKNDDKSCTCDQSTNPGLEDSSFWVLDEDELGTGINTSREPKVRKLIDGDIRIVDNYFKFPTRNPIPPLTSSTVARYLLEKMSLRVSLYDGKDFDDVPETQDSEFRNTNENRKFRTANLDAISQADFSIKSSKSAGSRLDQQRVRFQQSSVVWENIDLVSQNGTYNNGAYNHHQSQNALKSMIGSKRKTETHVVLVLNKVKMLFDIFNKDSQMAWRFYFMVQEMEVVDKVNISNINKMLYEYCSNQVPRRSLSNMFSIRLTCHRNFQDGINEGDLAISLKPLRINIDQDTLFFLIDFFKLFNEILLGKETNKKVALEKFINDENVDLNSSNSRRGSINRTLSKFENNCDKDVVLMNEDDEINMKFDDENQSAKQTDKTIRCEGKFLLQKDHQQQQQPNKLSNQHRYQSDSLENIFIKSFVFSPDVPIRLDYHGKHIDLTQGALPGIALGLAQLNESELRLKKLNNQHGLLGIEKVVQFALDEWSKDIKRNQLPSILGGVGPMHSFIQLFQGIRDLFWIPVDQYRKDQRIVRGLQRGTYAFSISTAMATLELANRLVCLIQSTAQFAHDLVTPPSPSSHYNQIITMHHNSQPRDAREGLTRAYNVVREGFQETARQVVSCPSAAQENAVSQLSHVIRRIPSSLVRPIIDCSQATSDLIVGLRNQLKPEARKDDHEKWKNVNQR